MTVGSVLDKDFSETSLRRGFVTLSSGRDGPNDCCEFFFLVEICMMSSFLEVAQRRDSPYV